MINLDNKKIVEDIFSSFNNKGILEFLEMSGYYEAPASITHHGNYSGGLSEHSLQVAYELQKLTSNLNLVWERKESPMIVGMLHDICKIDDYIITCSESGNRRIENIVYNENKILSGHGDKSCILALKYMDLTDEEIMCIRYHMGAFVEADVKNYSKVVKTYPNVLYTHTADMIASQIKGI